ncbi:MAG: MraY family glycosyltransferase [Chloroflexota bacterium]
MNTNLFEIAKTTLTDDNYLLEIIVFLLPLILGLITSKIAIRFAKRVNLMDVPNRQPHKIHKFPTPIAGGTAIFLSLAVLSALGILLLGKELFDPYLFGAVLIIFGIGLYDDFIDISARQKLPAQLAASILLILGNYQVNILDSEPINILISLVWFVGIINAFNLIDSSDGLLLGISVTICAFIVFASLNSNQALLNLISIGLFGLFIGIYTQNRYPAKLFLGDSGSMVIGLIFAIIALKYNPMGFDRTTSWISPILMMAFPIFDVTLVVVSRFMRKVPVFRGGLDHTYHRLGRMGRKKNFPFRAIIAVTLLLNILAFVNLYLPPIFSYTLFGIVVITGITFLVYFEKRENR